MQETKEGIQTTKLLLCLDGSPASEVVMDHCNRYARVPGREYMALTVLEDVIHYDKIPDTPLYQERKREAEKILAKARKNAEDRGAECKTKIAIGPVINEIVRIAEEGDFDYIMVGSRGLTGIKRMLLGSVADGVSKYAHCSVIICR